MSSRQKVWLITDRLKGTSSGFGEALVKILLARGDRVVASARNLSKIQHFSSHPDSHSNLRLLQLDILSPEDTLKAAVATAVGFWGHIDALVNNAGSGQKGILEETGTSELLSQFRTNLFAPIEMTLAVLPYMRARRSGTIVMIGSRSSWKPEQSGIGMYASSKAALRTYSETLAHEIAPFSIRMLIAEPAAFRTNTFNNSPYFVDRTISDYDEIRAKSQDWYSLMHKTIKGDPVKAMEVIADVVRGEGKAAGKPWPLYLPLGDLAVSGITDKCNTMLTTVEEWKDVSSGLDMDIL
ncbi:NAD(P)-binding protein [Mycena indigotica]|uniref:NAD(P)-binding protein n=1 Tax=Mycena indigotica TaxID=2126181 RepID=A0A8H6SQZ6_9AGAR|nr:NAD(P)-binding protein [Mycena indigotica]KAF7303814.1 NAD(P)-binding protein [Mycena indigotica]